MKVVLQKLSPLKITFLTKISVFYIFKMVVKYFGNWTFLFWELLSNKQPWRRHYRYKKKLEIGYIVLCGKFVRNYLGSRILEVNIFLCKLSKYVFLLPNALLPQFVFIFVFILVNWLDYETELSTLCCTVCPRSLEPFYIVTYYMNWVKTSWTYSMSNTSFPNGNSLLHSIITMIMSRQYIIEYNCG